MSCYRIGPVSGRPSVACAAGWEQAWVSIHIRMPGPFAPADGAAPTEFVLAELTLPFDRPDVAYFDPLMLTAEKRLGFRPIYGLPTPLSTPSTSMSTSTPPAASRPSPSSIGAVNANNSTPTISP